MGAYTNGISISDIYEKLYHTYKSLPLPENNINALLDFENVKDKIVYKLVNYEQNEALLKDIPYVPYLDLAIVFYLLLDINQNSVASMMIYNEALAMWGIDLETLYSYAKENTPKLLPVSIQSRPSVMNKLILSWYQRILMQECLFFLTLTAIWRCRMYFIR